MKKLRHKVILLLVVIYAFSSFLADLLSTPLVPVLFRAEQSWAWAGDLLKTAFRNAFSMAVFTLFIILGVREITEPVLRLSKAANRIARGDFDVEIPETKRQDEIGQLERSFAVMAGELKTTEYLQKDFISNVSHEYKTPLAVIAGYARLLADDGLTGEEREQYSGFIMEETQRLSRMTSNILLLSRLENQSIQPAFSPFSLDEQLRQAALLLLPECQEREIALEMDVPRLFAYGSEELLMHVWTNLLENAIKFTDAGGRIDVRAHEDASDIVVTVQDNGIGMDEPTQARVFDQFYQGDASRKDTGNGLGLSLALRIVQMHKGAIQVRSVPGEGTAFIVSLPKG